MMLDLDAAEQLALQDVIAVRTERDLLTVTGPDGESYLQGQVSQDVSGLAVGETSWTLLLQPQGKVESWLRVHRLAQDRFLLDVEAGYGQQAMDRLKRFMLRVDLEIELATVEVIALRGPNAPDVAATANDGVLTLDASWAGATGVDLINPDQSNGSAELDSWLTASVAVGPPELLEVLRVRTGRPAMGSELDSSTIPAAARIVDESVDFTKGCYVGQELVARVDSRGNNTPSRLYGLRFDGSAVPPVGAELALDGTVAGTVTSVAVSPSLGGIGLAYLKRAVDVPARLNVSDGQGETLSAAAVDLPLAEGPES